MLKGYIYKCKHTRDLNVTGPIMFVNYMHMIQEEIAGQKFVTRLRNMCGSGNFDKC